MLVSMSDFVPVDRNGVRIRVGQVVVSNRHTAYSVLGEGREYGDDFLWVAPVGQAEDYRLKLVPDGVREDHDGVTRSVFWDVVVVDQDAPVFDVLGHRIRQGDLVVSQRGILLSCGAISVAGMVGDSNVVLEDGDSLAVAFTGNVVEEMLVISSTNDNGQANYAVSVGDVVAVDVDSRDSGVQVAVGVVSSCDVPGDGDILVSLVLGDGDVVLDRVRDDWIVIGGLGG